MNSPKHLRKALSPKRPALRSLVALVLLFTAVLPAEYGFDPLKTGKALGLTGISQAPEVKKGAVAHASARHRPESTRHSPGIYKVDSEDFS